MQENHRAGAIMIFCGRAEGGKPSPADALSKFAQDLLPPLYGAGDINLVTGTLDASQRRAVGDIQFGQPREPPTDRCRLQ